MYEYLIAISICLIVSWFWSQSRPKNLPPGPLCFPLVKNLPHMAMAKDFVAFMRQKHQKYGPLMSLSLVGNGIWDVWLEDYELIMEVLNDQRFFGRSIYGPMVDLQIPKGLGWSTGAVWRNKRKCMMQIMRTLGVGKSVFATGVEYETEQLLEYLEANIAKPVYIKVSFSI